MSRNYEQSLRELRAFLEVVHAEAKSDIRRLEVVENRLYGLLTSVEEKIADLRVDLDSSSTIGGARPASSCRRPRRYPSARQSDPAAPALAAKFAASSPESGIYEVEIDGRRLSLAGQRAPFLLLTYLASEGAIAAFGIVGWKTIADVEKFLDAKGIRTSVNTLVGRLRDLLEAAGLARTLVQRDRILGLRFRWMVAPAREQHTPFSM